MMNVTMSSERGSHMTPGPHPHMPVSVQILSTIAFGAFAIVAVVLAIVHFWPAGVLLAVILGWRGGFAPQTPVQINADAIVEKVRALSPEATRRTGSTGGNASFDAYRDDMLSRLQQEQEEFDSFLGRLRQAKDMSEFDRFMDERAHQNDTENDPS